MAYSIFAILFFISDLQNGFIQKKTKTEHQKNNIDVRYESSLQKYTVQYAQMGQFLFLINSLLNTLRNLTPHQNFV